MSLRKVKLAVMAALVLAAAAAAAVTPSPDGAIVMERVFNDCPGSTVTTNNLYPAEIAITDAGSNCYGWANLHVWRMANGGIEALFPNNSNFSIAATMVIDGNGVAEAGLQIAPWWSEADGRLNVKTTADGEIACFGGRLPFYSFTANHGIQYVKGRAIRMCLEYRANGLNSANPATITYTVQYNGGTYSSGPLPFDQGNPAEDPPYGLWGCLNDAKVGGHFQPLWALGGDPSATVSVVFSDICFTNMDAIPTEGATWGEIKNMYR